MKKPISKTSAFVSGISRGGRRNLPQISDRLMAEVRRASKNEFVPFKRAVKDKKVIKKTNLVLLF